ncbi:MAG: type II toxin-antitoxin system HicA family toxin [Deferribacteraceae bacterium]|jgi:hypothetical protein|nr:type II toxin-antitoxin system HicA family toxin [Deferribacteraceae bacterium]
MNSKQQKILDDIFTDPIKSSILWKDIEALFLALGSKISEGNGSRVRVILNDTMATFHRPHPQPTTDKGAAKSVRKFLINAGVKP